MKYSNYFVQLDYNDGNYTGNSIIDKKKVYTNFTSIGNNIFIANFKKQLLLTYNQEIKISNKELMYKVIFPVLTKYNKRRLKKISAILSDYEDFEDMLLKILEIEKVINLKEIIAFSKRDKKYFLGFVIKNQIKDRLKLIKSLNLQVTLKSTFDEYKKEMFSFLEKNYNQRKKSVKLVKIEQHLKLPRTSLYFTYLLKLLSDDFEFKIINENLYFTKLPLTREDIESKDIVLKVLKKNKLNIFTFEDVLKKSMFSQKKVSNVLWNLIEQEEIMQLDNRFFIFTEEYNKIINRLKKYKRNQGDEIDIKSFRELTNLTRKHIIPIFEYFDKIGITQRMGNKRKILINV